MLHRVLQSEAGNVFAKHRYKGRSHYRFTGIICVISSSESEDEVGIADKEHEPEYCRPVDVQILEFSSTEEESLFDRFY